MIVLDPLFLLYNMVSKGLQSGNDGKRSIQQGSVASFQGPAYNESCNTIIPPLVGEDSQSHLTPGAVRINMPGGTITNQALIAHVSHGVSTQILMVGHYHQPQPHKGVGFNLLFLDAFHWALVEHLT